MTIDKTGSADSASVSTAGLELVGFTCNLVKGGVVWKTWPEDMTDGTQLYSGASGFVQGAWSSEEIREMLRCKAEELGSQKALAAACGVSDQFLSDIILGKREPSGKPLEFLGMRRTVRYERSNAD